MIEELKHYENMLKIVETISAQMPELIFVEMDKNKYKNRYYNSYFLLCSEIFRGLLLCCHAISIGAYSQIGTMLRQLIEQLATVNIIGKNDLVRAEYNKFGSARTKFFINHNDTHDLKALYEASEVVQERIKKLKAQHKPVPKINYANNKFFSLGWLEKCGATSFSEHELLVYGNLNSFIKRRSFFNHYVHSQIFVVAYGNNMLYAVKDFMLCIGVVFNDLLCSYNYVTGFDFYFDEHNNKIEFNKHMQPIIEENNKK